MLDIMPSPRLVFNQWDRHGTCTGFDGQKYFDTVRKARETVQIPAKFQNIANYLAVTPGEFDLIFVDLDKESYPRALKAAIPRLRLGGLYVADNALWSGRVADGRARDAETRALREHNRLALSDERLVGGILPVRDGLFVGTRIL